MFISHTVSFVKNAMENVIRPGDGVIDATVGGGLDTLFLSKAVGPQGTVFGFDVQQHALDKAAQRLASEPAPDNVRLFLAGHETMAEHIPARFHGTMAGAMFNLGYLPGSDQSVITRPASTCAAIDAALGLLRKGGVISMVLYTGHPGGEDEARSVESHCASLPMDTARIMRCTMHNQPTAQTRILFLEKR
jgi:predicted methyltransferase